MTNGTLESLENRVAKLEKVLLDLAKWTKFDLGVTNDDGKPKAVRSRKHDQRKKALPKQRGKSQVALKSTSGVRRKSVNPEARIVVPLPTIAIATEEDTINITVEKDEDQSFEGGTCLELVGVVYECESRLDDNGRRGDGSNDGKTEMEADAESDDTLTLSFCDSSEMSPFLVIDNDSDDVADDDTISELPTPSSSQLGTTKEMGKETRNLNAKRKCQKLKLSPSKGTARIRQRPEKIPSGKYYPLTVPPSESTLNANPFVKMKKLSKEWLEKKSIKIPPPRLHPFQCSECIRSFKSPIWLQKHLETAHNKPKVAVTAVERSCPYCPKVYYHKQHFLSHVRIHTNERPYVCSICGYSAKTSHDITQHKICRHTADRKPTYQCEKCELSFFTKPGLTKHQARDHGAGGINELAAKCPQCGLILSDKTKLKLHLSDIHEEKRNFACHLCGQMFKRIQHLRRHIVRHANPNRRQKGPHKKSFIRVPLATEEQSANQEEGAENLHADDDEVKSEQS